MAAKIKKGDYVQVISGSLKNGKGKKGEVLRVFTNENRVLVAGVNMVKRHVKPSQDDPEGGIKTFEAPIAISNVAHLDPKDGKPTRVGFKTLKDGKKVRVSKRSGEEIDV
jgi:large subunit ribosomal protein L24